MKHSQKQLAELKKIAEKIAMADFEKTTEDHQFSSDYQVKKAELLEQLTQESPSPKRWKKQLAIAGAVLLIAIPTTVFAGTKLYEIFVKKEQYEVNLSIKGSNNQGNKKHYFLDLGYLPSEMVGNEDSTKYSYKDNYAKGGLSFRLWKINKEAEFSKLNTGDYQEVTYGDNQGIITKSVDNGRELAFDRQVYVMFEKEGYLLQAYVGNDVSETELTKIMANIKLTETTKAKATFFLDYDQYEKEFAEEPQNTNNKVLGIKEDSSNLVKVGQSVSPLRGSFTYQVDKVEVLDSLASLDQSNLSDFALERMVEDQMMTAEGELLAYTQKTYSIGDGKTTIDQEIASNVVKPKFVYLTTTLTNITDQPIEDLYYQHPIQLLVKKSQEWTYEERETYEEPSALSTEVDYLDSHGEGDSYYQLPTIQPNEKRTIHVGYFVDEDQLDKMFLNVFYYGGSSQVENNDGSFSEVEDLGASDRWWIDIRQ